MRGIVGQQLSVIAARAIWGRLLERFGGRPPTPQEVLDDDPEELRVAVGLSHAKTRFLRSLAEHVVSGELELDRLGELSDEEVQAALVAVKGIGPWSAQIFLLGQLQRPDVIVAGDLGIRRAIERAYGLDRLPTEAEVVDRAEAWRPHRSAASFLLWHALANAPV